MANDLISHASNGISTKKNHKSAVLGSLQVDEWVQESDLWNLLRQNRCWGFVPTMLFYLILSHRYSSNSLQRPLLSKAPVCKSSTTDKLVSCSRTWMNLYLVLDQGSWGTSIIDQVHQEWGKPRLISRMGGQLLYQLEGYRNQLYSIEWSWKSSFCALEN